MNIHLGKKQLTFFRPLVLASVHHQVNLPHQFLHLRLTARQYAAIPQPELHQYQTCCTAIATQSTQYTPCPQKSKPSQNCSQQEAQLMLTNPCDAFSGQSRSPHMLPFDVLRHATTLKPGSVIMQGHRNQQGSIRHL